ncbi:MAG: hypothetical protein ACPGXL_02975 [Chitinophagales bacterium]
MPNQQIPPSSNPEQNSRPEATDHLPKKEAASFVGKLRGMIGNWSFSFVLLGLFIGLMVLGILAFLIQVPQTIESRVKVISTNPPVQVSTNVSGPITLFVADDALVEQGEYLGLVKNPAKLEHVLALKVQLETFRSQVDSLKTEDLLVDSLRWELGELQTPYSDLITSLDTYQRYEKKGVINPEKGKAVQQQISGSEKKLAGIQKKVKNLEKAYQRDYDLYNTRYVQLYQNKKITRQELMEYEADMNLKQKQLQQTQTDFTTMSNDILQLRRQLTHLNVQQADITLDAEEALNEAYVALYKAIQNWEQRYMLRAPMEGQLSYMQVITDGMFVNEGQKIMAVLPASDQELLGEMYVTGEQALQIDTSQLVQIEFDEYLKSNFGVVEAYITSIETTSVEGLGKVMVRLPKGLQSNTNQTLEFKHEMQGKALISGQEIPLFQHLFKN